MRARMVAAFALGFAFGALFIGVVLWRSGSLVFAAGSRKAAAPPVANPASSVANLPEPSSGNPGDLLSDLAKQPVVPPAVAALEPFAFSESPTPLPTAPPAPSSTARPVIGPRPPAVPPPAEHPPAEHGDANRIASERTVLPNLRKPIDNIDLSKLAGEYEQPRDGHKHEAIDILSPRGTPIHAVAQGNVAKLFTSKLGGLTVYQFDDSRTWCFYYAHLDHYAKGIQEGTLLRPGDVLGYVGSTGDASPSAPHLHFSVFKLGPEKKWWEGTPVDPLPLFQ